MRNKLVIELSSRAGRCTARYAGDANLVFGDTPQEAIQNLKYGWKLYGIMPGPNSVLGRVAYKDELLDREARRKSRKKRKLKSKRIDDASRSTV